MESAEKGERSKKEAVLSATRGEATHSTLAAETAAQTRRNGQAEGSRTEEDRERKERDQERS